MRRSGHAVLLLCVLALAATGCRPSDLSAEDIVRNALRATELQSRQFAYEDRTLDSTFRVDAKVEDDFRYEARLSLGDGLAYEEIVSDDAIAVRMHDQRILAMLEPRAATDVESVIGGLGAAEGEEAEEPAEGDVAEGEQPAGPGEGEEPPSGMPEGLDLDELLGPDEPSGPSEGEAALTEGHWVIDQVGAPSLLAAVDSPDVGEDPVYDALTVFRYVDQAIAEAAGVIRFDPESVAYRIREDRFEPPDRDAGEVRYDVVLTPMPRPQDVGATGQQASPSYANFRKLSVYIQDGLVTRVHEMIDVAARFDELERNYRIVRPEGLSEEQAVVAVLQEVNQLRRSQGEDPIRVRTMSLVFNGIGTDVRVALPADAVVAGLDFLRNRGSESGAIPVSEPRDPAADATELQDPEVAPAEEQHAAAE